MLLGILTAGFALKGFLIPNNFIDGGATGISLLIHELFHVEFSVVIVVVNIPFMIFGLYALNRRFIFRTLIAIVCLGICTSFIPYPVITSDKVLTAIFGGFLEGLGIGLTMRGGASLDGTEVLALYTLRRSSLTISEIIMGINVIIFSIAAFHFGIQNALYSMLTYVVASKTVDYIIEGIEEYTGVTIISAESERIKHKIANELGRGITIYKGERGYLPGKYELHTEVDIIFTVITRIELKKLRDIVQDEDPKAFVFANSIREASGGVLSRNVAH